MAIFLALLFVGLYFGYKFIPPNLNYQMFKYDVTNEAKNAHHYRDSEMRTHLLKKAADQSVPLRNDDLVIERGFDEIMISAKYHVDIEFLDGKTRRYYYSIRDKRKIKQ